MKRLRVVSLVHFVFLALLLACSCLEGPLAAQQTSISKPAPKLTDLAWMVGSWSGEQGRARIEEHWIHPAGKSMLGVSRTVVGDRTVSFEFLRIEERADGISYIAHPNARPGTEFKLTRIEREQVVFENLQHDNPKIIRYRKNPDGSLTAHIEGDEKGKRVEQEFLYRATHK